MFQNKEQENDVFLNSTAAQSFDEIHDIHQKLEQKRKATSSPSVSAGFAHFVDRATFAETNNKKSVKRGKQKSKTSKKTKVTINEIDELEIAMDLLFGEQ